jgi:hypothetical protein
MSGRARLPAGAPLRASQRGRRMAAPVPTVVRPTWRPGDAVQWRDYSGSFLRDLGDGLADITIGTRTYRVSKVELRPA